jgi:Tfp pilus assembly protein PilP
MEYRKGIVVLVALSLALVAFAGAGGQAPKPEPDRQQPERQEPVQKAEADLPPPVQNPEEPPNSTPEQKKEEDVALASYDSQHKRDPFQNLASLQIKPPAAPRLIDPPPLSRRPPGLAGLLISEVSVIGTANKADKALVVLRGTDKFTYMALQGTKLYDGFIESVTAEETTFVREVRDTAGNTITSKVVKR